MLFDFLFERSAELHHVQCVILNEQKAVRRAVRPMYHRWTIVLVDLLGSAHPIFTIGLALVVEDS